MRALLTGGIKAILAIAALSTAAHWAMRVQREAPSSAPQTASIPDPVSTGSIERRQTERPLAAASVPASANAGLDQTHLAALVAGAVAAKKAPRIAAGPDKAAPGPSKGGPGPAKPASGPAKVLASADKAAIRR